LNPNYKNTISRVTEIDSQYRPTLFQCNYPESCLSPYLSQASETMFSSKLTDTLNNTVSLKVSAINIPFSFYNVESNQGNSVYSLSGEQHIPNGYYDLSGLLSQLQTSFLSVSYDSITGKTTLTNTSGSDLQITFMTTNKVYFKIHTSIIRWVGCWVFVISRVLGTIFIVHIPSAPLLQANTSVLYQL